MQIGVDTDFKAGMIHFLEYEDASKNERITCEFFKKLNIAICVGA